MLLGLYAISIQLQETEINLKLLDRYLYSFKFGTNIILNNFQGYIFSKTKYDSGKKKGMREGQREKRWKREGK